MAVTGALLKRAVYEPYHIHHVLVVGDSSYPATGYPPGNGFKSGGGYNTVGYQSTGGHWRGGVTADGKLETYNLLTGNWRLYTAVGTEVGTGASVVSAAAPCLFFLGSGREPNPVTAGSAWPFGNMRISSRVIAGPASYSQTTGIPATPATFGLQQISAVYVPAYAEFGDYLCRWDKAGSCLRAYTAVGTEVTNATDLSSAYFAAIALGR